jgi:hypothetical protein
MASPPGSTPSSRSISQRASLAPSRALSPDREPSHQLQSRRSSSGAGTGPTRPTRAPRRTCTRTTQQPATRTASSTQRTMRPLTSLTSSFALPSCHFTPTPPPPPPVPLSPVLSPADGEPLTSSSPAPKDDNEDGPQSLLALLTEHLSLAFLQCLQAELASHEAREADRVICAYLSLLAQWLWEDPCVAREFLEAGGLGVLVE